MSKQVKDEKLFFLPIDGDAISEIIFGCCIDEDLESKIRKECQRKPKTLGHIRFFRCGKPAIFSRLVRFPRRLSREGFPEKTIYRLAESFDK
jgi:hypothetical protein